jgi:hypothetical protein
MVGVAGHKDFGLLVLFCFIISQTVQLVEKIYWECNVFLSSVYYFSSNIYHVTHKIIHEEMDCQFKRYLQCEQNKMPHFLGKSNLITELWHS